MDYGFLDLIGSISVRWPMWHVLINMLGDHKSYWLLQLDTPCEIGESRRSRRKKGPWRTTSRLMKGRKAAGWARWELGMLEWNGMNALNCGALEHSVGLRWVVDALLQRPCPFSFKTHTNISHSNNFVKRKSMKERKREKNRTGTGLCQKHRDYI